MLDKLCLGTVQLGLKYGIKNEIGRQPTHEESFSVLQAAIENGIKYFDTASVYGNAEAILREFGIGHYGVNIISKLKPNIDNNGVGDTVKVVQQEIVKSLLNLGVDFLDGYLLHEAKDFYHTEIIKGLQVCKHKGLVKNIGISVYEPEDALNAVSSGVIDYIQIPYNVFDQRLDQTDFFEIAKKNHVTVFARSAFLQGLLLMRVEDVPEYLIEATPYLKKFEDTVLKFGYSRREAAFLFNYCHNGIDKIVFGVDNEEQLMDNLKIIEKSNDFIECYNALWGSFRNIEDKIIIPSLWTNT